MDYFKDDGWPEHSDGRCSDNDCPCPPPGTLIPRGSGYLYIPPETVALRREFPIAADARAEMQRRVGQTATSLGMPLHTVYRIGPILVCEQGAKRRNLDLAVAAADARHWWQTGEVPLRATPRTAPASTAVNRPSAPTTAASSGGCGTLALGVIGLAIVIIWIADALGLIQAW